MYKYVDYKKLAATAILAHNANAFPARFRNLFEAAIKGPAGPPSMVTATIDAPLSHYDGPLRLLPVAGA